MATSLPEFPPFDASDTCNVGTRWTKLIGRLENLLVAMNIPEFDEDAKRKKALLLHFMGEQAYDIYDTLKADGDNYADVKQKLHGYFVPKVNLEYEKYVFS